MLEAIEISLDKLIINACKISDKVEQYAVQNLIHGDVDKVMLLVSVRQLSSIINSLKIQNNEGTGAHQESAKVVDNGYPDW